MPQGQRAFTSPTRCARRRATHKVRLNVGGRHNIHNSLAAAAAASAAGATPDHVVAGLGAMQPVSGRLQPGRTQQGARLIDDSYNANPSSMRAGIDVLAGTWRSSLAGDGRHGRAGRSRARQPRGDRPLRARARRAADVCHRATEHARGGVLRRGATWYPDTESLARAVNEELSADVSLLVKGSRSNRLERVVAKLTGAAGREVH